MNGDAFSSYLMAGEQLVWWDRPKQGLLLTARDGLLIPFSLMWGGFAVFWEFSVVSTPAPFFFKLWGVPFVLIGLFLIFGRFFIDAWFRRNTHYGLTNRRVLIIRDGPFGSFISLNLDQLPVIELKERKDRTGTIQFGPRPLWGFGSRTGFGSWIPSLDSQPQFLAIQDAKRVFTEIQMRQPISQAAAR
jgi:hypothetical protein